MNYRVLRKVRIAVQIFFFAVFVLLLFMALAGRIAFPIADIFFRLNPLSALTAMLAGREWIGRLGLALLTVGITLLAGRIWCGWVCPMGSLTDWVRFKNARKRATKFGSGWRRIKYILLAVILAAALFGNLSLLIFDPIAMLTRASGASVLPAVGAGITAGEHAMYRVEFLQPVVNWMESWLRGPLLPTEPAVFHGGVAIFLLLAVILGLNFFAHRFWCRFLCPLGALLGILSRFAILRPFIGSACKACSRCERACPVGAIRSDGEYEVIPSECVACMDCLAECPQKDIGYKPALPPVPAKVETESGFTLTRRQAMGAVLGAAGGVMLLNSTPAAKYRSLHLIRPPGVRNEAEFLAQCLRCSQCMRVCPTHGLQPAIAQAGLQGFWTPVLTPRLGNCDYGCNACGQVCPSGAIPSLRLEAKREEVIGFAVIDRNRCLPWASGIPCTVCEEMCPLAPKAITLEVELFMDDDGYEMELLKPVVDRTVCIGCGICEYKCPIESEAAIRVQSVLPAG